MEIKRSDKIDNDFYALLSSSYMKEYDEVMTKLSCISDITKSITELLEKHLSDDAKNFSIEYAGQKYEFYYPTTKEEFLLLRKRRSKFIKKILCDVVTKSIKRPKKANDYHNFLALMLLGEDPRDHQFEQIIEEEIIVSEQEAGIGTNESGVKGIPLDMEAYQVKSNMNVLPNDLIELTTIKLNKNEQIIEKFNKKP
jgi:hypothetical protein